MDEIGALLELLRGRRLAAIPRVQLVDAGFVGDDSRTAIAARSRPRSARRRDGSRRSKSIAQLTAVVTTTAISTPGQRGRNRRTTIMIASAPSPIASVGKCVSPACCSTSQTSFRKRSLRAIGTPSILFSCESAMMIAAALVKPMITGCERKLTIAPSLKSAHRELHDADHQREHDRERDELLACRARRTARAWRRSAATPSPPARSRAAATSPTARRRDRQKRGVETVVRAACPASCAYAIDCGTSTSATVTPAIRSARSAPRGSGNQREERQKAVQRACRSSPCGACVSGRAPCRRVERSSGRYPLAARRSAGSSGTP